MGNDSPSTTVVSTSNEPIIPIKIVNKLAANPKGPLKYSLKVKNSKGNEVVLADPMFTRAAVCLMNQCAVIGGAAAHWGGPAAYAEIMSAIHWHLFDESIMLNRPWYERYNFVNDAGHAENGIYALRANYNFDQLTLDSLLKFRSIESKLTGHGEAHLNPEGVYLSNGPLGSALPQAQGLALADKMLNNDRITLCVVSDGASMEGEAKEAFAAIAGLAKKNKLNPFVMIISDNNTKLSGRIEQDSFSMIPTFESLTSLGWEVVKEEEGNNLQKCFHILEKALEKSKQNPTKPVCIWLKTIKGFGVKSTMEGASGGHGYPLKPYDEKMIPFLEEIYGGKANLPAEINSLAQNILQSKKPKQGLGFEIEILKDVPKEKIQVGVAKALIRAAKEGMPVFSLSSDLAGSTGVAAFAKSYPSRSLDLGIAESNMISVAAGLSKNGFIPIVDTFAQFGVTKGNLPLTMAQLSCAPVISIFSHTGFQDAADGASHQATTYMAAVSSIPHTTVIQLSCSKEAEILVYEAIKMHKETLEQGLTPNNTIFFLGREDFPVHYGDKIEIAWQKPSIVRGGKDVLIVVSGSMVQKALEAAVLLEKQGIYATVMNNPFVNRPDVDMVKNYLNANKNILITIEDHQLIGGMGAQLIHLLKQDKVSFAAHSIGIEGHFGQSAYLSDHLYERHKMNAQAILDAYELLK